MSAPKPAGLRGRRYGLELAGAIVLYAVLLIPALLLLPHVSGPPRFVLMLAPVPGLLAVGWVVLRAVRVSDELQGRILVESMAIGFALGSLLTFTYGLLQVAGAPQVTWMLVWPVYAACWLLGSFVARRRY